MLVRLRSLTISSWEWAKYHYVVLSLIIVSLLIVKFSDYNLATGAGNLSLMLFFLANTYVPAKHLRQLFHLKNVDKFFITFLHWHCQMNLWAFLVACVHAYLTNWTNFWLEVALVLMGWLTFGGFLLKYRYNARVQKWVYLLHSQLILFVIMVYALLEGHYVFGG
ncbi:MAG: hypothetical protein HN353_05560 [Bdellovibrionales bacterium]|jgi:hypothetical protein|nr:hypothetical protein [Bdellovibrionales bacterium]MBT3525091.1 hypothetical protein [Bdellovibrionales bacterium]MBT7768250.1 hypothetical protein [Bdellovibrionales bacterium]